MLIIDSCLDQLYYIVRIIDLLNGRNIFDVMRVKRFIEEPSRVSTREITAAEIHDFAGLEDYAARRGEIRGFFTAHSQSTR